MKKYIISSMLLFLALCPVGLRAEGIGVTITTDSHTNCPADLRQKMEQNLGKLLTEINMANEENRALNFADTNVPTTAVNQDTKAAIQMMWTSVHFYCDDYEVVDRLWPLKTGYMLRQIPLIINPQEANFTQGTYQEASIMFNKQGQIIEFSFVFNSQLSESMEKCGSTVSLEDKMLLLSFCDRFRTYYNTKNIKGLEQIFSDNALIITGNVTTVKAPEGGLTTKVTYNKQSKQQYLSNLRRAFARNKYIEVKFSEIGAEGGCGTVTRSNANPNMYGVRLKQEWRSTNYSDDGYVFLLWNFNKGKDQDPVIEVRTWQPEFTDKEKTQPLAEDEIFSLSDFDL
ncbi:MAG: hypothetical protein IJ155_07270 [Prevotella sp.]|nr:hypothetical protein [Prevotella sp.]MBQ9204022.1 hypothetical protein [Prevotella sp.]